MDGGWTQNVARRCAKSRAWKGASETAGLGKAATRWKGESRTACGARKREGASRNARGNPEAERTSVRSAKGAWKRERRKPERGDRKSVV